MSSANETIIEMQKSIAELQAIVTQLGAAAAPGATDRYAAGDISWVLTSTALVFFMIPGVGYFYSGLTGRRNALSMILLSLISVAVVTFEWWLWGYSLTFSKTSNNPFIGNFDNAFLMNVWDDPSIGSPRVPDLVFCIFQGMFAAITPVLSLGSATERGRLMPMIFYIFLWSTIVYNPIAYWSWNPSGWGYTSGGLDYAGGTPVHIASGAAALAYSLILGQRRVHPEINKPHSLSHIILGTSMLWFGWLGFNGGSGLAANPRSAMACIVTNISASMGGIVWMMLDYRLEKKLSAAGFCTGAIAGLVTITPGSGFVTPSSALVFGLVGAIACNFAIHLKKLGQYDDALDVFAVHGMGGIVGKILTGIFAQSSVAGLDGTVIPGGWLDAHWVQIGHQIADSLAGFGYTFTMTYLILFAMNKIPGLHLRASAEEEELGMDAACIGELAYWHALNDATKAAAQEMVRTSMNSTGPTAVVPYKTRPSMGQAEHVGMERV